MDNDNENTLDTPWMYPAYQWRIYGPLLHDASCYSEFVLNCIIRGYVNPDSSRRQDTTMNVIYRYEPYEQFILFEACNHRGTGKMNDKARKFRDELIKLDIENGDRDEDGTPIPSREEIERSDRVREWCEEFHPNFLKIRKLK